MMDYYIIVDKSYAVGASREEIHELCDAGNAVMTEALFFEIVSNTQKEPSKYFRKLPRRQEPLNLLPNLSALVDYEISNCRPCVPLCERFVLRGYRLNPGLADGSFSFSNQHRAILRSREADIERSAKDLLERSRSIPQLFSPLRELRPGQESCDFDEIVRDAITDLEGVCRFYAWISGDSHPPAELIGPDWAIFRQTQVQLIGGLDIFWRYGTGVNPVKWKKLRNELIDLD